MSMARLPLALRLSLYGLVTGVLLYLTQAPSRELPEVDIWDKAEHAASWLVLAALGFVLFPKRAGRVVAFTLAFGGLVELLQWLLPFGRDPDWADWAADSVGVAAAFLAFAVARKDRP
jgi:VanZ family protein